MTGRNFRLLLLMGSAIGLAQPLRAAAPLAAAKRVYVPADFARFAPKTAYDMLAQVPSFTIRSADQERGLGQASENVLINGQRITNKSAERSTSCSAPRRRASTGSRSSRRPRSAFPAFRARSPT